MWNTCLIGRRWKPREGWSRPVLTGDGDIAAHSPSCVWGWVRVFFCCWIVPGDNERWNGHEYDVDERFVSRPLAGSRTATVMMPEWFPFWSSVPFDYGFCGGHGPGVTPGPFPNPEAKAWHGDGTAPGRVWESNTPPQAFLSGFPVEPTLRETPLFISVPDGIPLDGLAAPGRFFFAFSCRRSSGSSAAFITTRSDCAFPSPKQEFHVGASTNPMSGYRLSADGRPRNIIVQLSQA